MSKNSNPVTCANCTSRSKGIFCNLESAALEDLGQHKVMNSYKRGQSLFFQGNPPYGLYCVSSGKIKISHTGNEGKESIIRIAGPGDVIGHRSLFSGQNYLATATVIEDASVCFLDKRYIMRAISEEPSISLNLIQRLSREMGSAQTRSSAMAQKNVRERLAEVLLMLKTSYGVLEGARWKLDIKLTRDELASLVGTANETVIRFISEFKDDGILEQEGKTLYVVDEAKLVEFANLAF